MAGIKILKLESKKSRIMMSREIGCNENHHNLSEVQTKCILRTHV